MRTNKTQSMFALIIIAGIIIGHDTNAGEIVVYESLADVKIGRVFLSPEQRESLDARRGKPVRSTGRDATNRGSSKTSNAKAAGYIVSSSGETRIWSNGNFVVADTRTQMRFPGDVKVTRVTTKETAAQAPVSVDASLPDSGAADDGD